MVGYIFGGDTGMSYDALQKRRAIHEANLGRQFAPKSVGEGLSALGFALGTRMRGSGLKKAEAERQKKADSTFSAFQGLLGSGGQTPSIAPQAGYQEPSQMPQAMGGGGNQTSFGGDVKAGIAATAEALGVSPVDLATAISYETAGTFSPTKRGPTTQWGQHRGLIQFGEPQAKKYGVDWGNPIGTQLGPDGAITKYLRDRGVKKGMGLLDIYSAINAGGVGLYNRSDANNGGAPGSVRDKVEKQMARHRANAMKMFGDYQPNQQAAQAAAMQQPVQVASADPQQAFRAAIQAQNASVSPQQQQPPAPAQQPVQQPMQVAQNQQQPMPTPQQRPAMDPRLMQLMADPSLSPQRRSVMQLLFKDHLSRNAPPDPMKQLQMQKLQQEVSGQVPMSPYQREQTGLQRQRFDFDRQSSDRQFGLDERKFGVSASDTQADNDLARDRLAFDKDKASQTGATREYEFYAAQEQNAGRQPVPYLDFINAQKKAGAASTNVTVNGGKEGPNVPQYNKLPAGYVYKRGGDGQIMINEHGVPTAAPIEGGPAALEAEKVEASKQVQKEVRERGGGVVIEDIDRSLELIENGGFFDGTGFTGNLMKGVAGTDAFQLNKFLDTIKANSAFDKLQQMREASPTGGALGAVSEKEINLLQSAIGSLDQAQDKETLVYNLNRVKRIYDEIINGPRKNQQESAGGQPKKRMKFNKATGKLE